jgi:hypothetical protein
MRLIVNGVLTDLRGRVLLRQSGERGLLPIIRPLAPGTLPADTLARAFREDTALIVLPIRLTGLYYDVRPPDGELALYFRCTMRGGALKPESRVGFFDAPLPAALPARYRRRVEQALHHAGGPPHLERETKRLGARLGRLFGERPAEDGNVSWAATVKLIVNAGGQSAWSRAESGERWRLPAVRVAEGEAPWEAVGRLLTTLWPQGGRRLADLRLVKLAREHPAITFVFAASLDGDPAPRPSTAMLAYVSTDQLTEDYLQDDVAAVRLANQIATPLVFRLESEVSG